VIREVGARGGNGWGEGGGGGEKEGIVLVCSERSNLFRPSDVGAATVALTISKSSPTVVLLLLLLLLPLLLFRSGLWPWPRCNKTVSLGERRNCVLDGERE
jgi:hypothetical protein